MDGVYFQNSSVVWWIFGLVSFGIFDLTNLAILSAWTSRFVVVDMAWGMTANVLVASALWYISHIVPPRG